MIVEPQVFTPSTSRTPDASDAATAAAKIGYVRPNDRAGLATAANAAGMFGMGADYFVSTDGSWVRMQADGRVDRGVGTVQWNGIPRGTNTSPSGAPAPFSVDRRYAYTASHMRTTALGNLPMLAGQGGSYIQSVLISRGFAVSNSVYTHPDGSRVDMRTGRPVLSYNNYALDQLETWWCRSGSGS